jgi:hypothetical protein
MGTKRGLNVIKIWNEHETKQEFITLGQYFPTQNKAAFCGAVSS